MTKINKIVMKGFKSFAKHTELMFGGDFNIILGPNGSGKSNVLDALCFVLGKTSSKSLRAERSANLIYNGGKSKKSAKQGEVSIYFDNSNKRFPTEDKEVKATRVVRQNGQSVYKINDKQRTRQQMVDLLSVAKINPDGYNIIMQGDIVRFVEMPPIERRMLIEEIAGISVYEEKKNKALRELEKVDEKLKEADIILTERKTYLKELEKDRNQALKFKDMDDSLKQNKASLLKLQIDKKEEEKREIQKKMDEGNEKLTRINKKIMLLKKENEEKKKHIEDITKEIEEKGEVEQLKLNKEIESLKIDLTKKNLRIETCKNEVNKINKRKQDLKNNLTEIEKKIEGLNKNKTELEKRKSAQLKEKETINNKIKLFKEKHKLESVGDFEKSIDGIDKKSEELQKKIHSLREQQHNLIREKDKLQHQINTADERIKKVKQVEKEYKTQVEELKNKREEFKKSTLELNKLLNEDSSLALQIDNSRKKLQNANEELAKLKARDLSIKEVRYSNIAIKKVLEQKNKIDEEHSC